jgi:large subunit ribosomal protein L12
MPKVVKEGLNESKNNLYQISKSGPKSNPHYVLEKPDGSKQIDMMFDTYKDAEAYAKKKGFTTQKGVNENKDPEIKIGDILIKNGKKGKVIKVMDDMVNVDFGNGDVYGITLSRIKGNEIVKENKPGTQKQYNQEIDWIKYEVDYVPDNKEVYEKWPEPYKSKALKALEYRKRNFRNMSKDKLDSLKETKDTDLKIYQSELNMLNKIKPTGEKQLKRKKELEDKIASLQTNESKIRSLIHNLINEELNEAKRPAVSTEIKEIEKTNEALALEAKIKSIDEAIEKAAAAPVAVAAPAASGAGGESAANSAEDDKKKKEEEKKSEEQAAAGLGALFG